MAITERVSRLRELSLKAVPRISPERASLITSFYQNELGFVSEAIKRASAFKYLLENKAIWIGEDELIVGEKGDAPKSTPTFPELCCHSINDLDILDSREKIPFKVSKETRDAFEKVIIPYWNGHSLRDVIFHEMSEEWKAAYECGIFTEFMEQRAPGHTVLDDKIYKKGLLDFKNEIFDVIQKLDYFRDEQAYEKKQELSAMAICSDALVTYAQRYSEKADALAQAEENPKRKNELERIAAICRQIPAHQPRDFWEALQYYWFVHLGVTIELNTWDAFNPGRLDQHLFPYYQKGIEDGTLTKETAAELLHCFWIKFNNQPAPPKVGVTAAESSTYTDFALINMGGVKEDGSDAVNELTYLMLDVIEEMRLLQPSSCIQVSKKNPDRFIKRAARIVKTGFGQPSIFNTDAIIQELTRQGKSIFDARNGGASGCVEVGAFGKENYNLTGYFSMVKVLEITLNNGIDPLSRRKIGLTTDDATTFQSFEVLFEAFQKQLNYFIDVKIHGNNIIEKLYAHYMPCPFLSLITDDCIKKGKDYHSGGARYNTSYIQGVGLGTITDSLTAIKYHVFDKKDITMDKFLLILKNNYEGFEEERLSLINKTPKFGNDDDYADRIMVLVFNAYFNAIDGRPNTKGGYYAVNLLPTTSHVYFGSKTGATPDGRKAYQPLSEGISPVQGADRHGPTAVIMSAAKLDHTRTGGTLLNQKMTPHLLKDEIGLDSLVHLIRTYFNQDGHHIQFNVIDKDTLRKAQKDPKQYRDLIVRVAGYSDYFCDLSEALQEEIIARTEHTQY